MPRKQLHLNAFLMSTGHHEASWRLPESHAEANSDLPFVAFGRVLLAQDGIDYKTSGSYGSGMFFAWAAVQSLQIAGELDGGLTRSNFILALRSMDMTHPMALPGIGFNMNGNADSYFVEGSDVAQYNSVDQKWEQQGDVIELSGKSSNCVWDQNVGNCT